MSLITVFSAGEVFSYRTQLENTNTYCSRNSSLENKTVRELCVHSCNCLRTVLSSSANIIHSRDWNSDFRSTS